MDDLNKLLDTAKIKIFSGAKNTNAFLAPLLCQCKVKFSNEVPTAGTDGVSIEINPQFFQELPGTSERAFLLFHELWHVAKMHQLRRGSKTPVRWNYACDYHINQILIEEMQLKMPEGGLYDKQYRKLSEEEIYDLLPEDLEEEGDPSLLDIPVTNTPVSSELQSKTAQEIISAVASAIKSVSSTSSADVISILERFTTPQVNWRVELQDYFKDTFMNQDYSWKRPSRRFTDIYMPSLTAEDEGRLDHLAYFVDTSGSISIEEIQLFNSELKHIKDTLKPKKLSIIQFDTQTYTPITLAEDEEFHFINVEGRGGTSLTCVYEWIQKEEPTASVVFSDLYCAPMDQPNTPVIWCCVGDNPFSKPAFGKYIPIKEVV